MIRAAVLCFSAALASASHAAIFGPDDRRYVSTTPGSPYSPVGIVRVSGNGRATGTLISRCDVLTVQHVFGRFRKTFHDPHGQRANFVGSVASKHWIDSDGTIIAAGGWRHLKPAKRGYQAYYDDVGSDWMVIRLDECLGDRLGWAKLGTSNNWPTDKDPKHLQDAGFPIDRNKDRGLSVDPDCMIRGVLEPVIFHDCATMRGDSGGPVFRLITIDGIQRMEIVGIISAVATYAHGTEAKRGWENVATSVSNVIYDPSSSKMD